MIGTTFGRKMFHEKEILLRLKQGQLFFFGKNERKFLSKLKARRVSSAYATITLDQLTFFRLVKITRLEMRCVEALGDYWRISIANISRLCLFQPVYAIPFFLPLENIFSSDFFSRGQWNTLCNAFHVGFNGLWSTEFESKANVNGPNSVQ